MNEDDLWAMLDRVEGSGHYDRDGTPISMRRSCELLEDPDYRIVAQTQVGPVWLSTVWLGLDHGYGGARPLIFETMGWIDGHEIGQARYATLQEAQDAHAGLVALVTERLAGNHPLLTDVSDLLPKSMMLRFLDRLRGPGDES